MFYFTLIVFNNQLLYRYKTDNKNIERNSVCEVDPTQQNTCIYSFLLLQNHRYFLRTTKYCVILNLHLSLYKFEYYEDN